MDFYKKTQFLWSVVILITFMDVCNGLEGIPTWLCLGINSPFIKFKAEIEILGNNSVSLNLTKDDYTLMHHQGIEKLTDFIKPVDLRNSSTGYLKSNLMKKIPSTQSSSSGRRKNYVENPISEEMDKKEIEILDDPNSESNMDFIRMEKKMNLSSFLSLSSSSSSSSFPSSSSLSSSSSSSSSQLSSDRKYIVPMALRNPIKESTKAQQHNEQFSTNIDDLKNHILMLQNLTKNDKNFQSKFVVFPSLQREKNKTQSKFQSTTYPTSIYSPSLFSHTSSSSSSSSSSSQQRKNSYGAAGGVGAGGVAAGSGGGGAGISGISSRIKENSMLKTNIRNEDHIVEDNYQKENITIIPQVLLLNDQTPPDNADDERKRNRNNNNRDQKESVRSPHYRRRNFRKYPFSKTTSSTTTTTTMATTTTTTTTTSMATTTKQTRKNPKRQKLQSGDIIGGGNRRKSNRRQHNCKNLDTPRCRRQRRKQLLNSRINNNNNNNGNKTSLNISDSNNDHEKFENRKNDSLWMMNRKQEDDEKLSRSARSNYAEKNINRNIRSSLHDIVTKDFIISAGNVASSSSSSSSQTTTYGEDINLNPNLCYQVGGMTYGQQNLCYHNPSIMPAVSRGARAAIQECQHQFHNRRWNCTTTDDNTVFGPMTSIGSPEMAFIHALAAATVTSFIARACRDGQLPQCGCSRSSRPKQLHDDWTWGGCGDDLEFAYKISQDFIDIREKERKREARELISVPQNGKRIEDKQQKSDNGNNGGEIKNSKTLINSSLNNNTNGLSSLSNMTVTASATAIAASSSSSSQNNNSSNDNTNTNTNNNKNDDAPSSHINPEILLELQEKITKEILNSKLQEKEMIELQEKINREILNSKAFNVEYHTIIHGNNNNNNRKQRQHSKMDFGLSSSSSSSVSYLNRMNGISAKARSLMNLHNNEAGRRAVIKKTRITCKCHGISGSCSLITCWQQLSSIREIGDYLKEKYDEATEVKLNKRGRLQIKDSQYKIPTAHDLVYLDESPDWCRNSRQLQWPGTHGRVCNKTSSGLDGCAILCCGRGYNTKNRIVRERCNCKFHWCCQVKCEICVKVIEEYTCK